MRDDRVFSQITLKTLNNQEDITHNVSQYVDNLTDSIGGKSLKEVVQYTEDYMRLLCAYYKANHLQLNEDKMTFMVVSYENTAKSNERIEIKVI